MLGRSRFALGLVIAASLAFACTKQQVTQPQPLAIQCSATPTSGQAPLNVAFGLNLSNATGTVAVSISYGDGAFEFTGSSGADCRHLATYAVGTRTVTICVTDVNCPSWPICWDDPPLHPYQCRSYTVNAVP